DALRLPKGVGQAASRRKAVDASASTLRSVVVFLPRLRDERVKRATARISRRFLSQTRCKRVSGSQCPLAWRRREKPFRVQNPRHLQSIRLLNRSETIDSEHSL